MNSNSNLSVVNELEENCMQTQPSVLQSAKKLQKNFCWKTWWKEISWEINMCMGGWYYVSWVHGVSWCEMDSANWGERPVVDSHEHGSEPTVYVTGGELQDLLKNYQLLTAAWSAKRSIKVMSLIFFLRNYTCTYNSIYIHHWYMPYKFQTTFTVSPSLSTHFFHLSMRHCVSAHRHLQNGVLGVHSSRSQTVEVEGAKLGLWRGWGLDSSSCLAEPFKFVVSASLTSAHITQDWFQHFSSMSSQKTSPAEVCILNLFSNTLPTVPI